MKYIITLISLIIITSQPILFGQTEDPYIKFYTAAYEGDYQTVYLSIQNGINIDSVDYDGITALMYAAQAGNLSIVNLLIENSADINLKPVDGRNALIASIRAGLFEIAELLIRNGALIDEPDYYGYTPLLYAVTNNDFYIADMLLYYEANPDLCDEEGFSSISIASLYGNDSIVKSLINAGANLDLHDSIGNTALIYACQNDFEEIVDILLDAGADVNHSNNKGFSALHVATAYGHISIVNKLLKAGADINLKTKSDLTAYSIAKSSNFYQIRKQLKPIELSFLSKPIIDKVVFGSENSFSKDDFFTGFRFGFHEIYSGISADFGYSFRVRRKPVLIEDSENTFYQYYEKRHFMFLGLERKFYIESDYITKYGISAGFREVLSFGSYDGTKENPDVLFIPSPILGVFYTEGFATFQFDYQYLDFKIYDFSPHRFNLSILFNINIIKPKYQEIKAEWFY